MIGILLSLSLRVSSLYYGLHSRSKRFWDAAEFPYFARL